MVNLGTNIQHPQSYIMCLVQFHGQRIFVDTSLDDDYYDSELIPAIASKICSFPTFAPTPLNPVSVSTTITPSSSPTETTPSPTDSTNNPTTATPSSSPTEITPSPTKDTSAPMQSNNFPHDDY